MRHDGRVSSQSRLALTRRRVLPEGYGCGSAPHNCGAEKKQHRFALHSTPREFCGVWIRLQKVRQERTHFPRWTGIVTGDSRDLRFEFPGGTDCTSSCVRQDQPRETNSSAMKVFSKSATWSPSWRKNWASTTSPSTRQNATAASCHRLQEVVDPSFRERAWSIIRVSCCTFDTVRTARNRNRIHFAGNCREA